MKSKFIFAAALLMGVSVSSCKKVEGCTDPTASNYNDNAEKDDGSCVSVPSTPTYVAPLTYNFSDASGNSTVLYPGQTDRLNQLREMTTLMGQGSSGVVDAQKLKDMFANVGGDGNGNFTFTASKQLKDKCFALDQTMFEAWMDSLELASNDFAATAASGQAGTLSSGSSTYLFNENGVEYKQLIEKGLMGAVLEYQALNTYFGAGKMDVDNTTASDPGAGKYYTAMEHHFDEAFGYFGVDVNFPTSIPSDLWGKYCNKQDGTLNCNADIMDNFLKGRAAISAGVLADRDDAIQKIRLEWEEVSAYQAMTYLDDAIGYFGSDQAKYLHALSEAYTFAWNLRYSPDDTRRMTLIEHGALMALFPANFWDLSVPELTGIKAVIDAKF